MSASAPEYSDQNVQQGVLNRLRGLLSKQKLGEKARHVRVIINPAAGRGEPILKIMNSAFQAANVDWEVSITKEAGDGFQLAKKAVSQGVDVVAVHGGDGTINEVARALMGTEIPLAIIPGGTGNVMAKEIGLTNDLAFACALAANSEADIQLVDMGKINGHCFLLRAGMGMEATMVKGADREKKDRLGAFAYLLAAFEAMSDPPIAQYTMNLDGEEITTEGLTCVIANSGILGRYGFSIAPHISIQDGFLDVIVIRKADLPSLLSLAASMVGGEENPDNLLHWQVRQASIDAEPQQLVQVDGEIIADSPVSVEIVPQALHLIVPSEENAGQGNQAQELEEEQ
jgi:YegS/Rv2252/BmrU family lipid kinase